MPLLILLLQLGGFAALATAMRATPAPLRRATTPPRIRLARISGYGLITLSLLPVAMADWPAYRLMEWAGLGSLAGWMIMGGLTIARRRTVSRRPGRPAR
ncbi:DUF3325 family protein [Stakelama saccharophila]|uniref:DUF3325 family protein n=1 Tax=Stakelama saccharophila TaxID=3075605 RepID=A0ABZ0BBD1_9SPHN|nr:DUF3325 family protein [Stakelama sp. W311]WNO54589.1 DUF3325 family protein [Stakelama sp. W311]